MDVIRYLKKYLQHKICCHYYYTQYTITKRLDVAYIIVVKSVLLLLDLQNPFLLRNRGALTCHQLLDLMEDVNVRTTLTFTFILGLNFTMRDDATLGCVPWSQDAEHSDHKQVGWVVGLIAGCNYIHKGNKYSQNVSVHIDPG